MEDGGKDHHMVTIEEVEEMEGKMNEPPKLLNTLAGKESCCIFRVPQSLVEVNRKAYQPHIVSIGPYHHGKPHLKMIEEHKWKFLGELIARTPPNGPRLDGYLKVVASMETQIRDCYSEYIDLGGFDLIKMMVLDGLFIIELFARVGRTAPSDPDDPIFNLAWVFPFLARDLLRLENQIPFFILQTLFDYSKGTRTGGDNQTLAKLALGFFNYIFARDEKILERHDNLEGKHLLDFFRLSLIPVKGEKRNPIARRKGKKSRDIPLLQSIQSARKLRVGGIKFKLKKADTFLDIGFRNGVVEIPQIYIDDFTASLFLNSVAFEQSYSYCSKHMTVYTTFMECLVNTADDAGFLRDEKILENLLGTDDEVVHFFSKLGKDVAFDIDKNYLSEVFEKVNEHYSNRLLVHWAGFKNTYFNTPWAFMSALAAVILLVLSTIQAFYSAYPYLK